MNQYLTVTVMGILQGLTEFLPVSSSGHLTVLSHFFGFKAEESTSLEIMLHAGSLLAIVIFYFATLWSLLKKENWHLIGLIILGSVPAGVIGVGLKISGLYDALGESTIVVAFGFLITATVLRISGKPKLILLKPGETPVPLNKISWRQALSVGMVQAVAIVPGISRSGSTISAGIIGGIERESAATFSFLLALPAIGGAAMLEVMKLMKHGIAGEHFGAGALACGIIVSAAVSFGALTWLINFVRKGKLAWFSWYLYVLGIALIIWQIVHLKK